MPYFYAEIRGGDVINSATNWQELKAADLRSAKKEADNSQFFTGTSLYVAKQKDGDFKVVSEKVSDPINMNLSEKWRDVAEESGEDYESGDLF